jgi:hypothetical protein
VTLLLISLAFDCLSAQSCEDPFDGQQPHFDTSGWATDFCKHSVPFEEFRSGGPPRDGIPPIDEPSFVSVDAANDWIEDREPVIALDVNGVVRAYPLQILTWHEVVNDDVGGIPVAVTFCPLCYAAIVFERPEHAGEVLTFGTTGNLRRSDLVMWDRQTESWWQQFSGEAIVGTLLGTELRKIVAPLVSWGEFRSRYPDADVLSRDTGHSRSYGENPYVGYDDVSKPPWLYEGPVGDALRPMERVVGVELGESDRAYTLKLISEEKVLHDELDDTSIVVFWTKHAASALDMRKIADSKTIGSVGVYRATIDDIVLAFEEKDGSFIDSSTGSTWNVFGEAVKGPLKGQRLIPIVHHNTWWFVWGAFKNPSTLYKD